MVKNIGTPSLVVRYGGRVDSPPMSHGVSVFSLGDYHGSKTKLSFGRRTQVRLATHESGERIRNSTELELTMYFVFSQKCPFYMGKSLLPDQ